MAASLQEETSKLRSNLSALNARLTPERYTDIHKLVDRISADLQVETPESLLRASTGIITLQKVFSVKGTANQIALLHLLTARTDTERVFHLNELGKLGVAAGPASVYVAESLSSPDSMVRRAALDTLGNLGSRLVSIQNLLDRVSERGRDPDVRELAERVGKKLFSAKTTTARSTEPDGSKPTSPPVDTEPDDSQLASLSREEKLAVAIKRLASRIKRAEEGERKNVFGIGGKEFLLIAGLEPSDYKLPLREKALSYANILSGGLVDRNPQHSLKRDEIQNPQIDKLWDLIMQQGKEPIVVRHPITSENFEHAFAYDLMVKVDVKVKEKKKE